MGLTGFSRFIFDGYEIHIILNTQQNHACNEIAMRTDLLYLGSAVWQFMERHQDKSSIEGILMEIEFST